MFGGLCYYVADKPFAILLDADLALKVPGETLRAGCARRDGRIFNPGGGDFLMREYITLSDQVLMDEAQIDAYVRTSHRFIAGRGGGETGGLGYEDLLHGRDALYKRKQ
jgi:TfoX/Sxy family transcriptional regulator of competence genes